MHEIDGDGYLLDSGHRYFDDEDLPTRNATQVTHQWANAVQEEIANVIRGEGITLNTSSETYAQMGQLALALSNQRKATRIENDSLFPGVYVDDALTSIFALSLRSIYGCGYERHATSKHIMTFFSGYAVDSTRAVILTMPSSGFTKHVTNGTGWVAGDAGTGIPSGVTIAANTKLAIFLIQRSGGGADIGFDTSLTAANLIADSGCDVDYYRRIGTCMVASMSGSDGELYLCKQDALGDCKIYDDSPISPYYELAHTTNNEDWNDIIIPQNGVKCELEYQVAEPTGGSSQVYMMPTNYVSEYQAQWIAWNLCQASNVSGAEKHTSFMKMLLDTGYMRTHCTVFTGVSVRFRILGWHDFRDQEEYPV